MADFLSAFAHVLQMEGGYVDHPDDPGGETKYGISKRAFPDEDIPNLTMDRASDIYKENYWDPLQLGEIHDQRIAGEIFDTAVNMGTSRAVRIAQEAINLLGRNLVVDGVIGPRTIGALNNYRDIESLLKVLNGLQFEHYRDIVTANPERRIFFRGWMRRVEF